MDSSDDESYASSIDSEEEENMDNVYYDDQDYHDDERIDNNYYIGSTGVVDDKLLLLSVVSPKSFFKYHIEDVLNFLKHQSVIYTRNTEIQIIKMKYHHSGNDVYYTSINKTYYLRIIQRLWRKRLKEREDFYRKRVNIFALRYRELNGSWPEGFNNKPGLHGLLYKKT